MISSGSGWCDVLQRLVADQLTCVRGGRMVFAGLSFHVSAGEALVVTGRNGAGKSSLLRLVAGLVAAEAGTLLAEGADAERSIGEQCHYSGHADALKPAMTAAENLAFWRDLYAAPGLEPDAALEAMGIGHLADLPAAYLSAGQKRRLALARLFVARRPLWLLDEPTSALDVRTQALFARHMTEHLASGGLIMAATHADLGLASPRNLEIGG